MMGKTITLFAVTASVLAGSAAHAQEGVVPGAGSPLNLIVLQQQINALQATINTLKAELNTYQTCDTQGKIYSPGQPGADVNGCYTPQVQQAPSSRIGNLITTTLGNNDTFSVADLVNENEIATVTSEPFYITYDVVDLNGNVVDQVVNYYENDSYGIAAYSDAEDEAYLFKDSLHTNGEFKIVIADCVPNRGVMGACDRRIKNVALKQSNYVIR